ncbi:hypothetical protein KEM48_013493 [Puccinia striiformis f. sp. tritici PST-130]|nr:hypothetical protein KEM48_013493 [Puccinia striiformis f. sp. tritici PST-130]
MVFFNKFHFCCLSGLPASYLPKDINRFVLKFTSSSSSSSLQEIIQVPDQSIQWTKQNYEIGLNFLQAIKQTNRSGKLILVTGLPINSNPLQIENTLINFGLPIIKVQHLDRYERMSNGFYWPYLDPNPSCITNTKTKGKKDKTNCRNQVFYTSSITISNYIRGRRYGGWWIVQSERIDPTIIERRDPRKRDETAVKPEYSHHHVTVLEWIALVVLLLPAGPKNLPTTRTSDASSTWTQFAPSLYRKTLINNGVIIWAQRLHPKKRHYRCSGKTVPLCCGHNEFDISGNTDEELKVSKDATSGCVTGGQLKTRR